jgi:hypothetical protein
MGRPVGYRRKRDGRLVVDPVEGPVVSELFRRRAEGARIVDLNRYVRETGKVVCGFLVGAVVRARAARGPRGGIQPGPEPG